MGGGGAGGGGGCTPTGGGAARPGPCVRPPPPPDDVQPAPGGSFIPSTAGLATPLHENKRRILNPRSESIAARYVRLFPTPNIRFASTGKAVRQFGKSNNPAYTHGEFAIPAHFKQNPVFHFSNQDRLESQAAASAPSQDMLGVLIDSLTPESHAKSSAEISPARPRNLSAVFSSISAALTLSRTPSRSQGRSQSQESADMLCTHQGPIPECLKPQATQRN